MSVRKQVELFFIFGGLILASLNLAKSEQSIDFTIDNTRGGAFLSLEHANLNIPGWTSELANFWLTGLGVVSDPRSDGVVKRTRDSNGTLDGLFWANVGLQQFHMPFDSPTQTIPGHIGLTFPNLGDLQDRLTSAGVPWVRHSTTKLQGQHSWSTSYLAVESPTGVSLHLHESNPERKHDGKAWYGPSLDLIPTPELTLPGGKSFGIGMPYIVLRARMGTARTICEFYKNVLLATTVTHSQGNESVCEVDIGAEQALFFIETNQDAVPYDGHHIAVYVRNSLFAELYNRAKNFGLVWDNPRFPQFTYPTLEDAQEHHEFRVIQIIDLSDGSVVHELEHEIRSANHPQYSCRNLPHLQTESTVAGSIGADPYKAEL